jgi:hypothetical protein
MFARTHTYPRQTREGASILALDCAPPSISAAFRVQFAGGCSDPTRMESGFISRG